MSDSPERRERFSVPDQMTLILKKHGLQQLPTIGDGSCLFHALRMMLDLEDNSEAIRRDVLSHLRKLLGQNVTIVDTSSSTQLVDALGGVVYLKTWISDRYTNWDEYFMQMARYSTYADDPCLWAASSLYDAKITVYVSDGTENDRERIFSHYVWSGKEPTNDFVIGNYDQYHYVATAPLDSPGTGGSGGSGSGASKEDYVSSDVPEGVPADSGVGLVDSGEGDEDYVSSDVPAGVPADSGVGLVDSDSGDELVILLREKQGKKMKKVIERGKCSLLDMYKEAFPAAPEVSEQDWVDFMQGFKGRIGDLRVFLKFFGVYGKKRRIPPELKQRLKMIKEIYQNKNVQDMERTIKTLLQTDYIYSLLGWEKYCADMRLLNLKQIQLRLLRSLLELLKSYTSEPREKIIVNSEKRNRLVEAISTAIEIGLNYQMLEKFKVKPVPHTEYMTVEDLKYLNIELHEDLQEGKIQAVEDGLINGGFRKLGIEDGMSFKDANLKKVSMAVLNEHPYWEGIRVQPDLGLYISRWKLENVRSPKYINTTKRETLTKIYETFGSYDVNFDEATPEKLKKMCGLKTLKLAPGVHKAICEGGNIEEAFRVWQASDRSYKVLRDDVTSEGGPYIVPSRIEAEQDLSNPPVVEQVLEGNFINLARIIEYINQDNHEAELKSEPLELSDVPSDMVFAQKLSDAFVKLGFLPEGYPQYCGVKVGEDRGKRPSDGADPAAKRQRRKLFTPIEIH